MEGGEEGCDDGGDTGVDCSGTKDTSDGGGSVVKIQTSLQSPWLSE